ncbi:universal stress protein [Maribacter arcticus]|uniref:Nucleotide-binding universal stress protein, UspA family n=1 Tax=Maribacter arcticus TaxID=561365 RepID=A0A1T5CQH0_9FLAO|nr:universal stress protein [Maribacter arcticus]SKB61748.1 Nucleotide-binding universal stress protein, UspA family [Maribacter arcticus]|tara:strand:- start:20728 stop:21573 length:846 start_codon:yes stop_codon:yes gene_type:complete
MKHILIPTDFSSNANHAISYALNLFKCERTNFYFIHAYADEVYGPFHNVNNDTFEKEKQAIGKNCENELSKLVNEVKERTQNPLHHYEAITSFEWLVDAVNNFVNIKNIDLMIMGTKGKTASSSITFGSNTVQVFKYVKCPVLAIPDEYEYTQPKKILFPSNYMLPYKRRELKLLDTLSAQFKAQVHSLYISDFEDLSLRQLDNKKLLEECLPSAMLSFVMTAVENRAKAIMTYINENDMDLLVMVNSRHSFLEDMLYRSTIDEIGLTPTVPFLVMQNLPR